LLNVKYDIHRKALNGEKTQEQNFLINKLILSYAAIAVSPWQQRYSIIGSSLSMELSVISPETITLCQTHRNLRDSLQAQKEVRPSFQF
jgi:hypothetical protein